MENSKARRRRSCPVEWFISCEGSNMKLLIERSFLDDVIILRHPETLDVLAQRIRRDGIYVWQSEDTDIQKLCNDWTDKTTVGEMAMLIADALKCG